MTHILRVELNIRKCIRIIVKLLLIQLSISELIVISIIVTMEIIVFYNVPILLIYFILLNVLTQH